MGTEKGKREEKETRGERERKEGEEEETIQERSKATGTTINSPWTGVSASTASLKK